MKFCSPIGTITSETHPQKIEVCLSDVVHIDSLKGRVLFREGSPITMLFLIPPGSSEVVVITVGGTRQAGAFVLAPGEKFSMGDKHYQFNLMAFLDVTIEEAFCDLCHSRLKDWGRLCTGEGSITAYRDIDLVNKLLCEECYQELTVW